MFFVEGVPVSQGSMKHIGNGRIIHAKSKELKEWRDQIGWTAKAARVEKLEGAISLTLVFTLPKPKSVKRDEPSVKPDLDKLIRSCLDALTGIAYDDDGQVVEIFTRKMYGSEAGLAIEVGQFQGQDLEQWLRVRRSR